jgi:phosphatidylglycerophosphatase A
MKPRPAKPSFRIRKPTHFLALGFGSGLIPWAPGTWGTLAAIPLYLLLAQLSLPWYLLVVVLAFGLGVYLCDVAARDAGVHDHPAIVWDEVVGYLITMAAVPLGWQWVLAGFVWFRVFDIVKPWPISLLDRYVKGGFGIMIDDVLAGLFALGAMHALVWWVGAL